MKVCIVARNINSDYKGSFEFDQAVALKKAGHDVYVMSLDFRSVRNRRKIGFFWDEYENIHVLRCSIPIGPLNGKIGNSIYSLAVKKAYKKLVAHSGHLDIIHTHFITISYVTMKSIRDKLPSETKFIVTEHSSTVNADLNLIPYDLKEKAKYVYNNADKVIAVSNSLATRIYENFGITCDVIYNVYDEGIFKLEKRIYDSEKPFRFVSAGNFTGNKRMDFLIRSFSKAFTGTEAELYIFGDGSEKSKLEALINENSNESNIFLMGCVSRKEIADFYKMANVFVLLSEKETFGVSYIEAMATGMPVIASHSGGPEGFIVSECGVIVDDSEEKAATAMIKIKDEITSYDSVWISEYARHICGSEAVAKRLTELYLDVKNTYILENNRGNNE